VRGGGGGDRAHAVGHTREEDIRSLRVDPTILCADCLFNCRLLWEPEVLEWLHNTGCPWDVVTAFAAARGGHLEVLKWAREHGCPWDEVTCARAAEGGHLAVLQWAREHHCPWNSIVCLSAAVTGQLEVLQWVRENDATGEVWSERRVRNYAKWPRKQEVLTWLNQLSAP